MVVELVECLIGVGEVVDVVGIVGICGCEVVCDVCC